MKFIASILEYLRQRRRNKLAAIFRKAGDRLATGKGSGYICLQLWDTGKAYRLFNSILGSEAEKDYTFHSSWVQGDRLPFYDRQEARVLTCYLLAEVIERGDL